MEKLFPKRKKSASLTLPLISPKASNKSQDLASTPRMHIPPQEPQTFLEKITWFFSKPIPTSREVSFNGHVYPPNKVRNVVKNQKYNIFTFVPLVLYNEFKLFFNMFFLMTAITQFIPPLQTGYLISYVGPLCLVLFLTMMKELYDDYFRYKRDKEANSTKYIKLDCSGSSCYVPSSTLKVGDIIEVHSNQRIPADLVMLYASEPNGNVFIRTDQLDGETDWKLRKSIRYTQRYITTQNGIQGLERIGKIVANPPIENIYEFEGVFYGENTGEEDIRESLTLENTLWANTVLASGKIYGMVIYTGREMRSVLNAREPRTKIPKVDLEINLISKVLFVVLSCISLLLVGLQGFGTDWYVQLIRFITLLSTIIPISLRVNLDFAKIVFSSRINSDKHIPGTVAKNRSIPEDLGRIQFLLTDKTGTLTKNEMVLKKIALENGVIYSMTKPEDHRKSLRRGLEREAPGSSEPSSSLLKKDERAPSTLGDDTPELGSSGLRKSQKREKEYQLAKDFWRAIALCHNVTPIEEEGERWYQASSPDEIALVEGAESLGMRLSSRDQNSLSIQTTTAKKEEYEILANFPFSSEAKRMGIILRNLQTGRIVFYVKGADMVMITKVSYKHSAFIQDTCEALAHEGLRTLVIAQKYLTQEEFDAFKEKYDEATHALSKRAKKVQTVISTLEVEMDLLGITGVEDKLQDDVCNTLENMRNAGIKVWMLTGDKVETAITVSITAGLKSSRQDMMIMKEMTDPEEVKTRLQEFGKLNDNVLVIDGKTLELALDNCYKEFFECTTAKAPAIVCCRCSPTQKAVIVEGVKKFTGKRTCAVGDGGNDVGMIQAADVGIGIEGKEGKQAALAADYSILSFEYLNRLILWHGRNSYKGSSILGHFVIHRGLIISFIQAIFSFMFYDVSISIYTGILNLGYTTIFTWLPVFSLILDEDIDEERAIQFPILYKSLQKGRELNLKSFFIWMWWSLYQAAVIMICTLYMFDNSYYNIVTITFTALIAAELFNVWTTLNKVHRVAIISVCISMTAYILVIMLLKKDINASAITLKFLYNVIFLTIVSWLPLHIITKLKEHYAPSEQQKIMRGVRKSSFKEDNRSTMMEPL